MNQTSRNPAPTIVAAAAVVEIATGLVLLIAPAVPVRLLLGVAASGTVTVLGRCFGIALLALGAAWWPARRHGETDGRVLRSVLIYNALIALCLAWAGSGGDERGVLLWPAVALHGVVAVVLLRTWRSSAYQPT